MQQTFQFVRVYIKPTPLAPSSGVFLEVLGTSLPASPSFSDITAPINAAEGMLSSLICSTNCQGDFGGHIEIMSRLSCQQSHFWNICTSFKRHELYLLEPSLLRPRQALFSQAALRPVHPAIETQLMIKTPIQGSVKFTWVLYVLLVKERPQTVKTRCWRRRSPWEMSTDAGATRRRGKEGLAANGSSEDLLDGIKVQCTAVKVTRM